MSTAVVLGARGQSGQAIVRRLAHEGWDVLAASSQKPAAMESLPNVAWLPWQRNAGTDLRDLVPSGVDVVVHVTAFSVADARQLLQLSDSVGSAVVLSSLSVYSDDEGRTLDEADGEATFPAWPVPIPDDWITVAPSDATYSTRKVALEQELRNSGWPVTILRPGAIYGPFSTHLREWYFIKRVLDGRRRVLLPYGGTNVFQPTATVNLAALVARAAAQPASRTLNCGDTDAPSVAAISATVDDLMTWTTERQTVEGGPPAPTVGNNPWTVPHSVVVDMTRAEHDLGYVQESTYTNALRTTLEWAVDACRDRDWRDVFPTLARYPDNLFDYEAEDVYFDGPSVEVEAT